MDFATREKWKKIRMQSSIFNLLEEGVDPAIDAMIGVAKSMRRMDFDEESVDKLQELINVCASLKLRWTRRKI